VNERDIFIFFTKISGIVLGIYIISDKSNLISKGLAYVELSSLNSISEIVLMQNIRFFSRSIEIKTTEIEKNLFWSLGNERRIFNIAYGQHISKSKQFEDHSLILAVTNFYESYKEFESVNSLNSILIEKISSSLTGEILKKMYLSFGKVISAEISYEGKDQNERRAVVSFKSIEEALKASSYTDGMRIDDYTLKIYE